jgi:DNA-binding transcriptional ArsR family regulator
MSVLYQAGLVESRKEGRWIYFRLPDGHAPAGVKRAIDWIMEAAEAQERVRKDQARLKKILKMDPSELCKQQCCK